MADKGKGESENNPDFGAGNNGSVVSKYKGSGTPDDFNSWTWKEMLAAIVGIAAAGADDTQGFQGAAQVSNPQTLYDAANVFSYVQNTLQMVGQSILDQSDALSFGDNAPWKGVAADAFNQMMRTLGRNVQANAQVLAGDVAGDGVPGQLYKSGQQLENARNLAVDADNKVAAWAKSLGAPVDPHTQLVQVHAKQQAVDALTNRLRTIITDLSSHYAVASDGFTPPDTSADIGPNSGTGNIPPGGANPFDGGNNPFGAGADPFGAPAGDGGVTSPPVDLSPGAAGSGAGITAPPLPGGGGLDGGGASGSGVPTAPPPPVTPFPGFAGSGGVGGADGGPSGDGAGVTPSLSSLPGGGGASASGVPAATPPPVTPFPGFDGSGGADGGGAAGNGAGVAPPSLIPFPGSSPGGSSPTGGALRGDDSPFKDTSGLDTSGLSDTGTPQIPDLSGSDVGAGASGIDGTDTGASNGLDKKLEQQAPPAVTPFPGFGDTGTPPQAPDLPGTGANGGAGIGTGGGGAGGLDGLGKQSTQTPPSATPLPGFNDNGSGSAINSGGVTGAGATGNANQPGSGMPMMPPGMGGMGGAGQQNNNGDGKSDASGLLNPIAFPGDPAGASLDPSALHTGGTATGGGGLSGLDGLNAPHNATAGDAGGLPTTSDAPNSTDVGAPILTAASTSEHGHPGSEAPTNQQLLPAGAGTPTAGAPGSGMPMMPPGMGGMGGAGQQNNNGDGKSDASGLLNPTMFPGDTDDHSGDPSVLVSGAAGAAGGAGGLSGRHTAVATSAGTDPYVPTGVTDDIASVDNPDVLTAGLRQTPEHTHATSGEQTSDAASLLTPERAPFTEDGSVGALVALPGADSCTGGEHAGSEHTNEPALPPDRVAVVHGNDGDEDFSAWNVGATSGPVLPWLSGHDGPEHHDQGVHSDVSSPGQTHMATWRPDKPTAASDAPMPTDTSELRSSFAEPDPQSQPEPEIAPTDQAEAERTSADLLDRRSEQWDARAASVPGVLG